MSKGEIQYFLTFAAGIAAFWLSGRVAGYVGALHLAHALAIALNLTVTLAVYGVGMAALSWMIYGNQRSLRAILAATLTAVVLAALGAQLLLRYVASLVHTQSQVGFFMFVAFLLYGLFYVIAAALGRRMLH